MTGIIISYLILFSALIYIIIQLKGKWILKAVCILGGIYYSIAVAYSLNSLMGWPTSNSIPDNSRIIWVQIHEPDWIYFWIQTEFEDEQIFTIDPRQIFQYIGKNEPRIFKIKYTKDQHRKILNAMKMKKGSPGSQIVIEKGKKKKGKKGDRNGFPDSRNLKYKILNPFELMPKE